MSGFSPQPILQVARASATLCKGDPFPSEHRCRRRGQAGLVDEVESFDGVPIVDYYQMDTRLVANTNSKLTPSTYHS